MRVGACIDGGIGSLAAGKYFVEGRRDGNCVAANFGRGRRFSDGIISEQRGQAQQRAGQQAVDRIKPVAVGAPVVQRREAVFYVSVGLHIRQPAAHGSGGNARLPFKGPGQRGLRMLVAACFQFAQGCHRDLAEVKLVGPAAKRNQAVRRHHQ